MYHLDTSCNKINGDTGFCILIILVMFQAQIQSGEREGSSDLNLPGARSGMLVALKFLKSPKYFHLP